MYTYQIDTVDTWHKFENEDEVIWAPTSFVRFFRTAADKKGTIIHFKDAIAIEVDEDIENVVERVIGGSESA